MDSRLRSLPEPGAYRLTPGTQHQLGPITSAFSFGNSRRCVIAENSWLSHWTTHAEETSSSPRNLRPQTAVSLLLATSHPVTAADLRTLKQDKLLPVHNKASRPFIFSFSLSPFCDLGSVILTPRVLIPELCCPLFKITCLTVSGNCMYAKVLATLDRRQVCTVQATLYRI